jgi:hypothetical protein
MSRMEKRHVHGQIAFNQEDNIIENFASSGIITGHYLPDFQATVYFDFFFLTIKAISVVIDLLLGFFLVIDS